MSDPITDPEAPKVFIHGEYVEAASGRTCKLINPHTGQPWAIISASFGTQIKQFQGCFIAGWAEPDRHPEQVAEQFYKRSEAGMAGAIFGILGLRKELK